jgi:hypothetical protein
MRDKMKIILKRGKSTENPGNIGEGELVYLTDHKTLCTGDGVGNLVKLVEVVVAPDGAIFASLPDPINGTKIIPLYVKD